MSDLQKKINSLAGYFNDDVIVYVHVKRRSRHQEIIACKLAKDFREDLSQDYDDDYLG